MQAGMHQRAAAGGRRAFLRRAGATGLGLWGAAGWTRHAGAATPPASERLVFPPGFLLGVASSAYQIEGSWNADGKGESIWDRWGHIPGRVKVNGDRAADAYRRTAEDVALLGALNVNAYRFSIAWTRILPQGTGAVNPKGVAYYRDLLTRLRDKNIKSMVTMFHWDTPQALQERGGWTNPDMVDAFVGYARVLHEQLGDLVDHWTTFNEPWVTAFMGHYYGKYPPGIQDLGQALVCVKHILLAHGKTVATLKKAGSKAPLGITLDMQYGYPATASATDKAAAERENQAHLFIFSDPIWKGRLPEEMYGWWKRKGVPVPSYSAAELAQIAQPMDFFGLNYYHASRVNDRPGAGWPLELHSEPMHSFSRNEWQPEGLTDLLTRITREYRKPKIIITENGYGGRDRLDERGEVADPVRIDYIHDHLRACRRALDSGVDLRGYFVWSFLDDLEWGDYGRMGLVYVDYETGKRVIKQSGRWYAAGIRDGFPK